MSNKTHINDLAEFISGGRTESGVAGKSRLVDMGKGYYARVNQPDAAEDAFGVIVLAKTSNGHLVPATSFSKKDELVSNVDALKTIRKTTYAVNENAAVPLAAEVARKGVTPVQAINWITPIPAADSASAVSATRPHVSVAQALPQARA